MRPKLISVVLQSLRQFWDTKIVLYAVSSISADFKLFKTMQNKPEFLTVVLKQIYVVADKRIGLLPNWP